MANRPKENRAEQDDAPNMKLIEPSEGGIHSTVGTGVTRGANQASTQAQPGNQAGQNPRT